MGSLAGNEGIEPGATRGSDHGARPARHDAHLLNVSRSARDQIRPRLQSRVQRCDQGAALGERRRSRPPDPDRHTAICPEPAFDRKTNEARELDVIADLGMEVERDMSGIEGRIPGEQRFESTPTPAGERDVPVPKESVVDQEQGGVARLYSLDGFQAGVDGGNYSFDVSIILDLKPIQGIYFVGDVGNPEKGVQEPGYLGKNGPH